MADIQFDAYAPREMAARVENAGIIKGNLDFWSTLALSLLAGTFIGFGALFSTLVIHDSSLPFGFTKLLGGLVFCLGLILVIVAGAELFTGNNLIVMAYVSKKTSLEKLIRNWGIVFIGNFIGSVILVYIVYLSGHWSMNGYKIGATALKIAIDKIQLSFMQALMRGILCNTLVCLAVWLCFSCRNTIDKILAIIFPITAFVALGFEHSVANMYFIPAGLILKNIPEAVAVLTVKLSGQAPPLEVLTWDSFLVRNLLPVTIGNIIGGSVVVGFIYWFIYLRADAREPVRTLMTQGPARVALETTVDEAVDIMKNNKSSSVLVGSAEEAVGIVSEADIVKKVLATHRDPATVTVKEIMSSPLIAVDVKTPIAAIYQTMSDKHIRHIMVTSHGKQIGFVSVKDILREARR